MDLLDQVMEKNFGIHIDGNVEVDFGGFRSIIDMLGGVDIELTQAEADYICGRSGGKTNREDWAYLTEGMNHLNGEQALFHARNRSVGRSDYRRTERQQDILNAVYEKVMSSDASVVLSMADDIYSLLTTDLSKEDILEFGSSVIMMDATQVENYRIAQDGAYQDAIIRRMQVLVPDLEKCRAYLNENLYNGAGQE